jgi:hypothetical protein
MPTTSPKILTYKLTNIKNLKLNKEVTVIENFHYLFKNIIPNIRLICIAK